MKLNRITWTSLCLLSILSFTVWFKYSYPQLAFLELSINRLQALEIAKTYVSQYEPEIDEYNTATIFKFDSSANRYLQKTLGFNGLINFVNEHDFELFYWAVRFFKEHEKEEYRVAVSIKTGEVISYSHFIEENEPRDIIPREEAKKRAIEFLREKFNFQINEYQIKGDLLTTRDYRNDFSFSWMKNSVNIPWHEEITRGTAKLLMSIKISGEEILSFSKNVLSIPEEFGRQLEKERNLGNNITTFVQIFYYLLIISAIYIVFSRRNDLTMHLTIRIYLVIIVVSFLLSLLSNLNLLESIFFSYSTTASMKFYLIRLLVNNIMAAILITVVIIMPGLSGELLHYEEFKNKKEGGFLHYALSSFFTRSVSISIVLGYLICFIMLGMQAILVHIGQTYWGVWIEHGWMTQFSTAYFPFLVAFAIGFKASLYEETLYRLFAISWGKKVFKSTVLAVLFSSLIWGLRHSSYPIFPMWFKGLEIFILGIFLSTIYLRFGIITVIVAHYLFDAFWHSADFLFGSTQPEYFYSSLSVLLLPLVFAGMAFILNRSTQEREMRWHLNKHQQYNLEVLKHYLQSKPELWRDKSKSDLRKEISGHGWDVGVVDVVIDDLKKEE